jgi:hypothetical protein
MQQKQYTQPIENCCKSLDSEQIVIFMVAENCPAHSYTNSLENTNKVQLSIQLLAGIMHSTVTPQQESVLQKLQFNSKKTQVTLPLLHN